VLQVYPQNTSTPKGLTTLNAPSEVHHQRLVNFQGPAHRMHIASAIPSGCECIVDPEAVMCGIVSAVHTVPPCKLPVTVLYHQGAFQIACPRITRTVLTSTSKAPVKAYNNELRSTIRASLQTVSVTWEGSAGSRKLGTAFLIASVTSSLRNIEINRSHVWNRDVYPGANSSPFSRQIIPNIII